MSDFLSSALFNVDMAKQNIVYPVTKETMHAYAASIFKPIKRKECVTTVWVPMAGRRMWNKFIIENINLFSKELPGYEKYLLVYIEPLDLTEESLVGYMRLMVKSFVEKCKEKGACQDKKALQKIEKIIDSETATYSKLLDILRELVVKVSSAGYEVIFFLGEFDELNFASTVFFNNLKSLWSKLYPKLHYVFLMRESITRQEKMSFWGELNEAILQNLIYVPLRNGEDNTYLINYFIKQANINLSEKERKLILKLCGGHPFMMKVCVRVVANNKKSQTTLKEIKQDLMDYYELRSVSWGIYEVHSVKEQRLLRDIAKGKKDLNIGSKEMLFLRKMKLVGGTPKSGYKLFSDLFKESILAIEGEETEKVKKGVRGLRFDEGTGAVFYNNKHIEEHFSIQEYAVLSILLSTGGNKISSRGDIGEALWGEESYEKYSDWAIDQLMSKLRKKLKSLGIGKSLVTIRGKGYKIVHPS